MGKTCTTLLASLIAACALASPSGLTPTQIASLKKAGKVVIPTFIPEGFKVVLCSAFPGSYTIQYRGPEPGVELTIEMASQGIGDIVLGGDADKKTLKASKGKVSNVTFGKRDLYVATAKNYMAFSTSWVDLGKKAKPRFFCIIGHQIDPIIGAKIYQGLKYLN
ncbi:MAG TPA: hypothetical protein VGL56_14740 [Fimbriimonadaceae bacterium]|jgi:hypothetical protein